MRIAYVCADPGVPVFGRKGCSIHVQEVLRALLRRGVDLEIHAARVDDAPPPDLAGLPIFRLPIRHRADPGSRELASIAANHTLQRNLESRPAFDALYERQSLWSTGGMAFARAAGIPGILEVNAPLVDEQEKHRKLVRGEIARASVKQACTSATCIIAVSEGVACHLREFDGSGTRIHVVPNGVDARRFTPRARSGSDADPATFTVGFVGSFKPWHGLSTLVEAFAHLHRAHPESRLLIVGDGPERENINGALEERGLFESTVLTGAVAAEDIPRWLQEIDVGVAPYPAIEGFYFSPLKILEYMAAGLPIVASRIGQIPQLLEDGACGLLCAPGEPEPLARELARLRSNPALRNQLAGRAREAALCKHSWDGVVARILEHAGLHETPRGPG